MKIFVEMRNYMHGYLSQILAGHTIFHDGMMKACSIMRRPGQEYMGKIKEGSKQISSGIKELVGQQTCGLKRRKNTQQET